MFFKVLQMRNELAELQKTLLAKPLSQRTRWVKDILKDQISAHVGLGLQN